MQWFESFDILETRCTTNSCTKDLFKPSSDISISIELATRLGGLSSIIYSTSIATLSAGHQSVKSSSRYPLAKSSISVDYQRSYLIENSSQSTSAASRL